MKAKGKTDVGRNRKNNEDFIYVPGKNDVVQNLYIVADGMGGYNGGEIASSLAVSSFVKYIKKEQKKREMVDIPDLLTEATLVANKAVHKKSRSDRQFSEMGTTLVAATVVDHIAYVIYVGDSRAYLYREGKLLQLSTDHSYVMDLVNSGEITKEEAWTHPKRNMITRAVGISEKLKVDMATKEVYPTDLLLLCTDGLSGMLSDSEMEKILEITVGDLEEKVTALVDAANERGGKDNVSVILIKDLGGRGSCY
ncbi:MAG: Stp1/IreP family PP2C-type Ser/Thr phosphatase [Bacillota bacterium]